MCCKVKDDLRILQPQVDCIVDMLKPNTISFGLISARFWWHFAILDYLDIFSMNLSLCDLIHLHLIQMSNSNMANVQNNRNSGHYMALF